MCDTDKGVQIKDEIVEDIPSDEVLLAYANKTREAFYQDLQRTVTGVFENQKDLSLSS